MEKLSVSDAIALKKYAEEKIQPLREYSTLDSHREQFEYWQRVIGSCENIIRRACDSLQWDDERPNRRYADKGYGGFPSHIMPL
jgi:hypothetical protein